MARAEVVRDYGGVSADERRAERRRKLLHAARQMWGTVGVADVSVRGVCAEAGLTPRYFYEQFPNLEALLLTVDAEVRDELVGVLVPTSLAVEGGIDDKFRAALVAFLELLVSDPHVHRIVTSSPSSVAGLAEQRRATLTQVSELVATSGAELLSPSPSAEALHRLALFIVGGVNGLVEEWLASPELSPSELADVCTRFCVAAVAGL